MTSLSTILGPLDQSSALPLYQQLQRVLRDAIEKRVLDADDALPAERELAETFGVSRITVRKALDGLVSEGLLVRQHGSGTFVRPRVEKNFSKLTSFSEDMRARTQADQRLAAPRRGHRDAGGSAGFASQPRHPGLPLPPGPLCR